MFIKTYKNLIGLLYEARSNEMIYIKRAHFCARIRARLEGESQLTVRASHQTVDAQVGVALVHLLRADLGQGLDRAQAAVFGQGQRDSFERLTVGSHCVLLQRRVL